MEKYGLRIERILQYMAREKKKREIPEFSVAVLPSIRVIGIKTRLSGTGEENTAAIKKIRESAASDGTVKRLIALNNAEPKGLIGLNCDFISRQYSYALGVASTMECPEDMEEMYVPEFLYAIFTQEDGEPETIASKWRDIYENWFTRSNYMHKGTAEVEVYGMPKGMEGLLPSADGSAGELETSEASEESDEAIAIGRSAPESGSEIWIPVVERPARKPPDTRGTFITLMCAMAGAVAGALIGQNMDQPAIALIIGVVAGIFAGDRVKKLLEKRREEREAKEAGEQEDNGDK